MRKIRVATGKLQSAASSNEEVKGQGEGAFGTCRLGRLRPE